MQLNTPMGHILQLPPAAAPLVVVLCNVPLATYRPAGKLEGIIDKIIHWLSNRLGPHRDIIQGINMVRRVSWVGQGPKRIPNDCIVVNFRHAPLAAKALSLLACNTAFYSPIQVHDLGFFYSPSQQRMGAASAVWHSGANVFHQNPPQRPLKYAKFKSYNRFTPFSGLDDQD